MRILFTNNTLDARNGTELYTREVALALLARGHRPMAFTLEPGEIAEELMAAGIPVVDDLRRLPEDPDLIHGQHAIETTLAALTFRTVPVLSFCHGPEAWQEAPCRLPNVAGWVAVDEACRQRLLTDEKIPEDRVSLLLNFVDLECFQPRPPLPDKPVRALVFSNYLTLGHPVMEAITEACAARGISVEGCGSGFGKPCRAPWEILPGYDLVFAKARCALEAMACGCAVVQAEYFGAGRLVSPENFDAIRPLNFGFKSMTFEPTAAWLGQEIDRYDAAAAAVVSARVRAEASLSATVDRLEELHAKTAAFRPDDFDPAVVAADFLRFHCFLSKQPMNALRKTKGVPLRLPVPPLPGPLRGLWETLVSAHPVGPDPRMAQLESKAAGLAQKLAAMKEKNAVLRGKIETLRADREAARRARGWRKWLGLS